MSVLRLQLECMASLANSSANCSYFSFNFQKFLKCFGLSVAQERAYTFQIFRRVYACARWILCNVHGNLMAVPQGTQLFQ